MKFLVYSDLHATEGGERCRADPACPLSRYQTIRLFEQLRKLFLKEKCNALIDLGDTTHDRSFIYRTTADLLAKELAWFSTDLSPSLLNIKLIGNHEQLMKSGNVSSGNFYAPYFSYVVNGSAEIDCSHEIDENVKIFCLAYADDYRQANEKLEAWLKQKSKRKILLAHGDVAGYRYQSGELCSKGLDLALLKQFDLALLGHIHGHFFHEKNVLHLGSPFQQDFSEANQQKFAAVLTVTKELCSFVLHELETVEHFTLPLSDFLEKADPKSENRYQIILNSIEETEQFYASPLSAIGEPRLVYSEQEKEKTQTETEILSDRELLTRFVKERPLEGFPDFSKEELVEIGEMFLQT